jgi:hypothetical protein
MLHESARKVEAYLRERGIPYVAVDEAKRALFGDASIGSFDFVIYREDGPNLLAFAGSITSRRKAVLRQWEQVFGRDFMGAFAVPNADGDWRRPDTVSIRFLSLSGNDLDAATLFAVERSAGR